MSLRAATWTVVLLASSGCGGGDESGSPAARPLHSPAFHGEISHATADKPQSKLWYARGRWWAWLPTIEGSRIWSRGEDGWRFDRELEKQLAGWTGRADVWADENSVRVVLVASERLSVVALEWNDAAAGYRLAGEPVVWPLEERSSVETATIARDGTGHWWVAWDRDRTMWVRQSVDESGTGYSEPIAISQPADSSDLCTIVALPEAVGVFWSDRIADAFLFRRHPNGNAAGDWDEIETVISGSGIADDHLNAAVASDGTLYVATRSGFDRPGRPQLLLHVRRPAGEWVSHPYGLQTPTARRGRPIVLVGDDSRRLSLCHSVIVRAADGSRSSYVAGLSINAETLNFKRPEAALIRALQPVTNVCGPKAPLPAGVAPLVLASDDEGNLYEGRLKQDKN